MPRRRRHVRQILQELIRSKDRDAGASRRQPCASRDIYFSDWAAGAKAMKPRYVAALALIGWSSWTPSVTKTVPKDYPNCAVTLVAQNSSQSADTEAAKAEAESMEDVRQRHLPEMLKIPHVVNMGIELKDSEIIFNVQVDKEENVPQVERMVPSEIEGYDVDVEAVPTGYTASLPSYHSGFKPASPADGQ